MQPPGERRPAWRRAAMSLRAVAVLVLALVMVFGQMLASVAADQRVGAPSSTAAAIFTRSVAAQDDDNDNADNENDNSGDDDEDDNDDDTGDADGDNSDGDDGDNADDGDGDNG